MTQEEYEALTEYEQDKMYWVTYPFTGCYLVWKNGIAIMGEGCTDLPVYSDDSATGQYFCANRNIVINFNPVISGFVQSITNTTNKWVRWGNNLELVEMTDNVDSIGKNCFKEHTDLKGIKLSNNISEIPGSLCSDCKKLERVIIGSSTLTIGESAFSGCSSLTSITIPDSVTSIGESAFSGCSSLTSITIPDSVTSIGDNAFRGCSSLTSITIPDSVTSIGSYALSYCKNLANIYFKGTETQWNVITKGSYWNEKMGTSVTGGTVIHYNS